MLRAWLCYWLMESAHQVYEPVLSLFHSKYHRSGSTKWNQCDLTHVLRPNLLSTGKPFTRFGIQYWAIHLHLFSIFQEKWTTLSNLWITTICVRYCQFFRHHFDLTKKMSNFSSHEFKSINDYTKVISWQIILTQKIKGIMVSSSKF